jgi:hypothetical protein
VPVVYDVAAEQAAIEAANTEYEDAYRAAKKVLDAQISSAQDTFESALVPAREKRDRLYAEAHKAYYAAQAEQGDMSDEVRELFVADVAATNERGV